MKTDVELWARGEPPRKILSKETLNHRGLIELVSGLDPYRDTAEAYRRAYQALGIDFVNRMPLENAPPPTPQGGRQAHPSLPYDYSPLGVYDTVSRRYYPCADAEAVYALEPETLRYQGLVTPVPHPLAAEDIRAREAALGPAGCYYPMLYTTLFMWGVEWLGWQVFSEAALEDEERFHERFLLPCVARSRELVATLAQASTCPFVFLHDDLATATGPAFSPAWFERWIFPHYPEIFSPAKAVGKKICFVADGNMSIFLPRLKELGVDAFMGENPATPLETCLEHFGGAGRGYIGGIDTRRLTFDQPRGVEEMVRGLEPLLARHPGFALASCGGLHGNIPLENLVAYFDARADLGATPKRWRSSW